MLREISTDVLILGGGPSGMFASFVCGMVGLDCVILETLPTLGGQCAHLYPDKHIFDIAGLPAVKAKHLVQELCEQMNRFKPRIVLNQTLTGLDTTDGIQATTKENKIHATALILATGTGAFRYNRPALSNIESLEANGYIDYAMIDLNKYANKAVVVGGGGDSAIDWCLSLLQVTDEVYLIHRRDTLRGMAGSQAELFQKISPDNLLLGCNLLVIEEAEKCIELSYDGAKQGKIKADYFIPCYGLQGEKGFLQYLDLELNNNDKVIVDPTTCLTSLPGIYCIGDANTYPNKRDLLVCGFAEAAKAAYHIAENRPNFKFEYSTTKFGV